ncbi:MAG: type II secretion system F family protein [Acidimicrobiales bacterium]|nr:type II secretion system F family protein [Acidimicrobiales bacterium]
MSPVTFAAAAASLAVLAAAAAWVRPLASTASARTRVLARSGAAPGQLAPACPHWFVAAAARADLPEPLDRWWWSGIGGVVATALAAWVLGGPVLAILCSGGVAGVAIGALRGARHRRDERLARSVPDSLEAIARSTRGGSSVVQAMSSLAGDEANPADRLFASVATRVHRGESLRDALEGIAATNEVPAVRLAVAALLVGTETGAAPGRAVDGVAATLRDRAALDREATANASQAKASVAVLVLAPLGFGVFAVATDPRVGDFLFRSWVGWVCLGLGLGLDALGWVWMRSIMRGAR